jgi:hypothetical protein
VKARRRRATLALPSRHRLPRTRPHGRRADRPLASHNLVARNVFHDVNATSSSTPRALATSSDTTGASRAPPTTSAIDPTIPGHGWPYNPDLRPADDDVRIGRRAVLLRMPAWPETVTVLFTDVVGSTAWRARVGDEVADVRTVELERASRQVVDSLGGSVVKGVGDGVMATFGSGVAGLDAAAGLQGVARRLAVGGSELCLRVGVSTGDMVREGEDWLGAAGPRGVGGPSTPRHSSWRPATRRHADRRAPAATRNNRRRSRTTPSPWRPARSGVAGVASAHGLATCRTTTPKHPAPDSSPRGECGDQSSGQRRVRHAHRVASVTHRTTGRSVCPVRVAPPPSSQAFDRRCSARR